MPRRTGGHQSQVEEARRKQQTNTYRNVWAFFLFLVAIGFVGVLWWLLSTDKKGKTHLVIFYVQRYSETVADSATQRLESLRDLYVANDLRLLQENFPKDQFVVHHDPVQITSDASAIKDKLDELIQGKDIGEADHLVFYFALQGISQIRDGELQPVTFQNSTYNQGEAISEILTRANQIPCASQLYLMETGSTDISLGDVFSKKPGDMFIPERVAFQHFLVETLRTTLQGNVGSKDVWAICSHRLFETSNYLHSLENSIFAESVAFALQKAKESNQSLTIGELFKNVRLQSQLLSTTRNDQYDQQPLLVDCGTGLLVNNEQLNREDRGMNAIVAFATPSSYASLDGEEEEEEEKPFDADKQAKAELESFQQFWTFVQQIEKRNSQRPVTPVDFAPIDWANLLERTLENHVRRLCNDQSKTDVPQQVLADLELLAGLLELKDLGPNGGAIVTTEFREKLAEIKSTSLREIAQKMVIYLESWVTQNKIDNHELIEFDLSQIIKKTLALGRLNDELFHARFFAKGFDADPVNFSAKEMVERVRQWHVAGNTLAYSRPSLFENRNLISTEVRTFSMGIPNETQLRIAKSPLYYEQLIRTYVIQKYLARNSTFDVPELDAVANTPLSDAPLSLENGERYIEVLKAKSDVLIQLSVFDDSEPVPAKLTSVTNSSVFGHPIADQLTSSYEELDFRFAVSGFRPSPEVLGPAIPVIAWKAKPKSISLSVANSFDNVLVAQNTDQEVELRLTAVNVTAQVAVDAKLENVNKIEWISEFDDTKFREVLEVVVSKQPKQISLRLKPRKNVTDFKNDVAFARLKSIPINLTARAVNEEQITSSLKLNVRLPLPDEFRLRVVNAREKDSVSQPESAFYSQMFEAVERPLTIKPLTTIKTPVQFFIKNLGEVSRRYQLSVYHLPTRSSTPIRGKMPPQGVTNFEAMKRDSLRLVWQSEQDGKQQLAPSEWTNVRLKKQFSGVPEVEGPLLLVLDVLLGETRSRWFQWIQLERYTAGKMLQVRDFQNNRLSLQVNPALKEEIRSEILLKAYREPGTLDVPFNVIGDSDLSIFIDREKFLGSQRPIYVETLGEPRALKFSYAGSGQPVPTNTQPYFAFAMKDPSVFGDKLKVVLRRENGIKKYYFMFQEGLAEEPGNNVAVLHLEAPSGAWSMDGIGDFPAQVDRDLRFKMDFDAELAAPVFWAEASDFTFPLSRTDSTYELTMGDRTVAALTVLTKSPRSDTAKVDVRLGVDDFVVANDRTDSIELSVNFERPKLPFHTFEVSLGPELIVERRPIPKGLGYIIDRNLYRKTLTNTTKEKVEFVIEARMYDYFGTMVSRDIQPLTILPKQVIKPGTQNAKRKKDRHDHTINVTGKKIYEVVSLDDRPLTGGAVKLKKKDGSVVKVSFFSNERKVKFYKLPNGKHTLVVKVLDNASTKKVSIPFESNEKKTSTEHEIE